MDPSEVWRNIIRKEEARERARAEFIALYGCPPEVFRGQIPDPPERGKDDEDDEPVEGREGETVGPL